METLTQGQSYMGGTVGYDSVSGKPLADGQTTPSAAIGTPDKPISTQQYSGPIGPSFNPPTVVTSGNINSTVIPENNARLGALTNTGITVGADGVSRYADGSMAPVDQHFADTHDMTSANSPYKGVTVAQPASNTSATPDTSDSETQGLISQMKASNDAQTKATIDQIHQQYEEKRTAQDKVNEFANSARDASLLTGTTNGGSARYAQLSSSGIQTAQFQYGLQQINDLNNEEMTATAAAKSAGDAKNYELMSKQLDIAEKKREEKQAAATKIAEQQAADLKELRKNQLAATMSANIAGQFKISTDPATILNNLRANGDTTTTLKDINDAIANMNPDQKSMRDILTSISESGAPQSVKDAVASATNFNDAIKAAGVYLQKATGQMGDYLQYKKDAMAKGLTPMDYTDWKPLDDQKTAALKASEAYSTGYNSAAGKAAADAKTGTNTKAQQALEQQGRQVIEKEFSARTGALGIENAKVNQANHLNSLFTQYYDPKTGNYNIPSNQYNEIAIGLANLVSGTGMAGETTIASINAATAAGDFNKAIQYATGNPQNGNTQSMIKNALDSVDRQALTAQRNRQAALENMKDLLPTDLESSRRESLIKGTNMVGYEGQDRVSKTNVDKFLKEHGSDTVDMPDGSHSNYYMVSKLYEVPGATNKDIEDYLKAQGKL